MKFITNTKIIKSFSLLELIFAISLISILTVVAVSKIGSGLDKANIIKIKNDIALIREGLKSYEDKQIYSNKNHILTSLEDSDNFLFDKILTRPILASNKNVAASWSKLSNSSYKVWLNDTESLTFSYKSDDYTFDCDYNNDYCKELTQ
ncbi:MAG: type II secretion system protein [Campylobacterota bacterium]|nr:type II secretion system protein [Campylobacterota bacterium]